MIFSSFEPLCCTTALQMILFVNVVIIIFMKLGDI